MGPSKQFKQRELKEKQMVFASGVVRPHPKTEALKWRILKTQTKKDRLFDVHELLEKFIDIL